MATPVIPPRYSITADDKRGLLVVNVGIALPFVWTCFFVLLWQRMRLREWKLDDWALAAATMLQTVQASIIIHLVGLGLGASLKGVSLPQLERLARELFVTQILYVLTLLASKCAILCLYLRLSPEGLPAVASWSVMAASCIWAVTAIVLISVPCNTLQSVHSMQTCSHRVSLTIRNLVFFPTNFSQWPKWQAIGAIDMVIELCIFCIAVSILWDLHIRLSAKFLAMLAFAARLPVIAAAGIRLYYLHQELVGHSFTGEYMLATQWQMAYAIMASTITGIGPFLRPFITEYAFSYQVSAYGLSSGRSNRLASSSVGQSYRRPSGASQKFLLQSMGSRRKSSAATTWDLELPTFPEHDPMPALINHFPHAHVQWATADPFRPAKKTRDHHLEATSMGTECMGHRLGPTDNG